jgi:hypothetical protein
MMTCFRFVRYEPLMKIESTSLYSQQESLLPLDIAAMLNRLQPVCSSHVNGGKVPGTLKPPLYAELVQWLL